MSNNIVQNSFSSGEISPTMYGRTDMAKYQNGLEICENFFVDFRGGASNRGGLRYLGRTFEQGFASHVRVKKFQVSTIDTYVLEFGNLYMRVIRGQGYVTYPSFVIQVISNNTPRVLIQANGHDFVNGDRVFIAGATPEVSGSIYIVSNAAINTFELKTEDNIDFPGTGFSAYVSGGTAAKIFQLVTPYTDAQIPGLKFSQSTDTMIITHPEQPVKQLTRTSAYAWTLADFLIGSPATAPVTVSSVASDVATPWSYAYVVTSTNLDGRESAPSGVSRVDSNAGKPITIEWSPVLGTAFYSVYKALPAAVGTQVPGGASYGWIGNALGTAFADTNIVPDFSKQPPTARNPFYPRAIESITVLTAGAGYAAPNATITDSLLTGSGAAAIAFESAGNIRGIQVKNGGKNYGNAVVTLSGPGAGFTYSVSYSPDTGTYPSVSAFFQQRLVLAASYNEPSTLWGSKPGQYENMDVTVPTNSGDAFTFTLSSNEVNNIKSLVAMPGGLVIFTGSAIWQLSGSGINAPVLPTNAVANPQSYHGAGDLQPIAVDYNILYPQISMTVIHELTYNAVAQNYTTLDITVFSGHLFYRDDQPDLIVSWAYSTIPFKTLHVVKASGELLILTYMKEQELAGWSRHTTKGNFLDVTSAPQNGLDVITCVTQRFINGAWRRSIEQFVPRQFPNGVEDAWFLDCAAELPMSTFNAYLTFSAVSGTGVTCTANVAVFAATDIGRVLRAGGGRATITGFTSPTIVTVDFVKSITQTIPQTTPLIANIVKPYTWSITTPVTTIYGLSYLEGQTVKILADGNVVEATVTNGRVTLPNLASRAIVGLSYMSQIKPLPIITNPTTQGRFKKISKSTLRLSNTRGLEIGSSEAQLVPIKERGPDDSDTLALFTGSHNVMLDPLWSESGQVLIRQPNPLPATVLAIAHEVELGSR